jgi:SAM-dependent methyltransferase
MNYRDFYLNHETYITHVDTRLEKILQLCEKLNPSEILDVGCGNGLLLDQLKNRTSARLYGTDIFDQESKDWVYKRSDLTNGIPFDDDLFDVVIFGEVIEHVPDPDFLLDEIWRTLKPGGRVIITTPNLASWANRILLLIGIQPLFTETSSRTKMGRKFKILGQGAPVEGHLKIFTLAALREIVASCGFEVTDTSGVPFFFPFPISKIDEFLTRFPSVSSGLLVVAQKVAAGQIADS